MMLLAACCSVSPVCDQIRTDLMLDRAKLCLAVLDYQQCILTCLQDANVSHSSWTASGSPAPPSPSGSMLQVCGQARAYCLPKLSAWDLAPVMAHRRHCGSSMHLTCYFARFTVSQHDECIIAVHNTNSTSSGEHKVGPRLDCFKKAPKLLSHLPCTWCVCAQLAAHALYTG